MAIQVCSRRALLAQGCAVAGIPALLAALLAACGDDPPGLMSFLNRRDTLDPSLIGEFERATPATVGHLTYASDDELADRLALPGLSRNPATVRHNIDAIVVSNRILGRLIDEGMLQELDRAVVTDALLANLSPDVRRQSVDPEQRFSVPYATGATGIAYDAMEFGEPPGWDVFLEARYTARMTLLDDHREAFAAARPRLRRDPVRRGVGPGAGVIAAFGHPVA